MDVCDSVAGFPRRPCEVLDKDVQVARCGVSMYMTMTSNIFVFIDTDRPTR